MARPGKYDPAVVARIVQAVEMGATYELACGYAGISESTFYAWKKKPEFLESLKAAEGRAAVKWLAQIEQASREGTWQAAAWKLERRHPQDYGRTITEHQGSDDQPIAVRLIRRGG